jgi:para-nitrobenzyl esterase
MGRYWVNFATTGSPNDPGLPQWPLYTAESGDYLEFGDAVTPGSGLETQLCAVFDRYRQAKM